MTKRHCPRCHRYYPATQADCPACGPPWWRRPIRLPFGLHHHGPTTPADTPRDLVKPAGIAALIALAIVLLYNAETERAQQAAQHRAAAAQRAADTARRDQAACRQAAKCWGDKHWPAATVACMRRVDLAAQYATRWPSGLFNPVFLNWEWRDQAAGTLVYVGRVELQNGFGAWAPYIVGCLYDPATGAATDLELRPGRL